MAQAAAQAPPRFRDIAPVWKGLLADMTSVEIVPIVEKPALQGSHLAGPTTAATTPLTSAAEAAHELPSLHYQVLQVEAQEWATPGHKSRFVRRELKLTPTRYYQTLNRLLDDPRAEAHNPLLVRRLRRERDRRVERWR